MGQIGVLRTVQGGRLGFHCPGCDEMHVVNVGDEPGPRWGWNGSYEKPTFSPSILIRTGHHVPGYEDRSACWCSYNAENPDEPAPFECSVCHSFVRDGMIEFLGDCTHPLANQTVPLTP